jgi:predicted nucleic acid-binding protein
LKTFLDSGVLLSAWRGNSPRSDLAREILADESREFISSEVVKLELLPKPAYEKRHTETQFYQRYFALATSEPFSGELGHEALVLAKKHGLAAVDALHLASAIRQGAAEFVTTEQPGKPVFRAAGIKVVSLQAF